MSKDTLKSRLVSNLGISFIDCILNFIRPSLNFLSHICIEISMSVFTERYPAWVWHGNLRKGNFSLPFVSTIESKCSSLTSPSMDGWKYFCCQSIRSVHDLALRFISGTSKLLGNFSEWIACITFKILLAAKLNVFFRIWEHRNLPFTGCSKKLFHWMTGSIISFS